MPNVLIFDGAKVDEALEATYDYCVKLLCNGCIGCRLW